MNKNLQNKNQSSEQNQKMRTGKRMQHHFILLIKLHKEDCQPVYKLFLTTKENFGDSIAKDVVSLYKE